MQIVGLLQIRQTINQTKKQSNSLPAWPHVLGSFVKLPLVISDDGTGTWNLGFGYQHYHGLKASRNRFFFIFCQMFAIFDDFSKWSTAPKVLQNFEKSSNLAWNGEKALLNLPLIHFSADNGYPKIVMYLPIPQLNSKKGP